MNNKQTNSTEANAVGSNPVGADPAAPEPTGPASGSAWRDAATDPPTLTGKILVWVNGVGPAIVTVEEDYMSYWDGEDESELTTPEDWDFWATIANPPSEAEWERMRQGNGSCVCCGGSVRVYRCQKCGYVGKPNTQGQGAGQ